MLFTILVPCYHANKEYFLECIDSIYKQIFNDFECIVISSDNSIVKDDLPKDTRFKYVFDSNKESSGSKRNYGILNGKGEYIVFVDCDDIISPIYLEVTNEIIKKESSPDMVLFPITNKLELLSNHDNYTLSCKSLYEDGFLNEYIKRFTTIYTNTIPKWVFSGNPAKAYKISFLKKNKLLINEQKGLIGEDKIFNLECAFKYPHISYSEIFYSYWWRPNPNSFFRKGNGIHSLDWLNNYLSYCDNLLQNTQFYTKYISTVKDEIIFFHIPKSIRQNKLATSEIHKMLIFLFNKKKIISTYFCTSTQIYERNKHKMLFNTISYLLKHNLFLFSATLLKIYSILSNHK